jgi:transposase InsO family protein
MFWNLKKTKHQALILTVSKNKRGASITIICNCFGLKRDALFTVLRKHQILTPRKKYSARTTNLYHHFYKYSNIIKYIDINRQNHVWASDITSIRTLNGFCYLALITDMYSRKIVGYDLSDSLELKKMRLSA